MKERITLKNGVKIYPFSSFDELISFIDQKKGILIQLTMMIHLNLNLN